MPSSVTSAMLNPEFGVMENDWVVPWVTVTEVMVYVPLVAVLVFALPTGNIVPPAPAVAVKE